MSKTIFPVAAVILLFPLLYSRSLLAEVDSTLMGITSGFSGSGSGDFSGEAPCEQPANTIMPVFYFDDDAGAEEQALKPALECLAQQIIDLCQFNSSWPVRVITNKHLRTLINDSPPPEGQLTQYLLIRPYYQYCCGGPISSLSICGLRAWLSQFARQHPLLLLNDRFKYLLQWSNLVANEQDNRVQIRTNVEDYPPSYYFWLPSGTVQLSHIWLITPTVAQNFHFILVLCSHLILDNTKIQNVNYHLPQLINLERRDSSLSIYNSEVESLRPKGTTIFLNQYCSLYIDGLVFRLSGTSTGMAIVGTRGADCNHPARVIQNLAVYAPSKAAVTGIKISQVSDYLSTTFLLQSVLFSGGIQAGIDFTPLWRYTSIIPAFIDPGSDNLTWDSTLEDSQPCKGDQFIGQLIFNDGFTCNGSLLPAEPETVESVSSEISLKATLSTSTAVTTTASSEMSSTSCNKPSSEPPANAAFSSEAAAITVYMLALLGIYCF